MKHQKIRKAYINAAKIIEIYGDTYLPIFERLHHEMIDLEKSSDLIAFAKHVAEST